MSVCISCAHCEQPLAYFWATRCTFLLHHITAHSAKWKDTAALVTVSCYSIFCSCFWQQNLVWPFLTFEVKCVFSLLGSADWFKKKKNILRFSEMTSVSATHTHMIRWYACYIIGELCRWLQIYCWLIATVHTTRWHTRLTWGAVQCHTARRLLPFRSVTLAALSWSKSGCLQGLRKYWKTLKSHFLRK